MKVLTDILTILNLCTVQFFGIFDSNTSLYQSSVPAVIVSKEIRNISQKTREILKSIQPASLSQKCLNSGGTAVIAFISVNDPLINTLQNEPTLNPYINILGGIATLSNPTFVLLQIKLTNKVNKYDFIFDWTNLPITSQLILFDAETIYRPIIDPGPSLRITLDSRMILRSDSSPLNAVKKKIQEKLNFNGRYIRLPAGLSGRRAISDCSLNLDKLLTHAEICIVHFLQKQINFSTTPTQLRPSYTILKLYNSLADNVVNDVIINKRNPGLQWLTHGVKFDSYKLTLITKLQSVNVDSLLQPFDRNMWMALMIANCLFFTVVCVGSKFKKVRKLIFWMISTTLSQMDETLTKYLFDKDKWINFALVSSWYFLVFLLSMLYQGDLYSCLTNVRLPILPNSLRETLITNMPLFTIGDSCRYLSTGSKSPVCDSGLLSTVIPEILKTKDTNKLIKIVASNVLNRTEHIGGKNPAYLAALMYLNSDLLRVSNNKSWVTPDAFGILSSSRDTDEFTATAKFFFNGYNIQQTSDPNPFITFTPWFTKRGRFASAVSSRIGSLSESGLIARWRKHYLNAAVTVALKTEFKSLLDLGNKILDEESTEQERKRRSTNGSYEWEGSGRVFTRLMLVPDKNLKSASVQSVPLLVMKLPFLACLVLASFSTGVFLSEVARKRFSGRVVGHRVIRCVNKERNQKVSASELS
jgi:hypothetical protein